VGRFQRKNLCVEVRAVVMSGAQFPFSLSNENSVVTMTDASRGRVYWEGMHHFQCSSRGPLASPLGCVHKEAIAKLQQPPYGWVKEPCDTEYQPEFTFTSRKVPQLIHRALLTAAGVVAKGGRLGSGCDQRSTSPPIPAGAAPTVTACAPPNTCLS